MNAEIPCTLRRVRAAKHDRRAVAVGIVVVKRRILAFPCIFGKDAPRTLVERAADIERIDEFRKVEHVKHAGQHYVLVVLMLEHIRPADHPRGIVIAQRRHPLFKIKLCIRAIDLRMLAPNNDAARRRAR